MQSRMASAAKGTFGDRADSRAYAGTKDEDLQEVVKWFHGAYQHFMYTVQTNESGTEYQKQLNRELHKCNSFLSICEERAYTLAVTVLRNEQEREDDLLRKFLLTTPIRILLCLTRSFVQSKRLWGQRTPLYTGCQCTLKSSFGRRRPKVWTASSPKSPTTCFEW